MGKKSVTLALQVPCFRSWAQETHSVLFVIDKFNFKLIEQLIPYSTDKLLKHKEEEMWQKEESVILVRNTLISPSAASTHPPLLTTLLTAFNTVLLSKDENAAFQ